MSDSIAYAADKAKEESSQNTDSVAVTILKNALNGVETVLQKSESSIQLLQQNLNQTIQQRNGLTYQKVMLTELITNIQKAENK